MNETNTSSSQNDNISSSDQANINPDNIPFNHWHDPASNFGYGVGRLLRGAFDQCLNAWQRFWNAGPSHDEITAKMQALIYKEGLAECIKHLDGAIDNLRKNPNDPESLKRVERLAERYPTYIRLAPTPELIDYQQKYFQPIEEKISRLPNAKLKNSIRQLLPLCASEKSSLPTKEIEQQKRHSEQTSPSFNTVNLPLDDQVQDMVIEGNYAYTVNGEEGLKIIDVSDQNNATLVSQYDTPGDAQRIVLDKGYAYIADGSSGLRIINVQNITNPIFAGMWMMGNPVMGVAVVNGKAYIADGTNKLTEIDVSVPENVYQAIVTTSSAVNVAVSGNYVYVADEFSGLRIIDVSNATNPQLRGTLATTYAYGVAVSGHYAYVADGSSGFRIIDVSNATNPQLLGTLATTSARGVAVSGNYAYLASGSIGLRIIDVSNVTNPQLRSTLATTDAYGVAVSGHYAYVADDFSGLRIIDVSNATNPQLRGTLATYDAQGVAVSGNVAYVADYQSGLRIIDVSNATNPRLLSSLTTMDATGVAVSGNYAYVTDANSGLLIIDVSNVTNPHLISSLTTTSAQDVAVSGNYAYVADANSGLRIIKISPLISENIYFFREGINQLSKVESEILVLQSNGFQMFNPAIPVTLTNLPLTTGAKDVAVSGNYAYVADYSSGLLIIDGSNATNPYLLSSLGTTYADAQRVAVSGNYAYVADLNSGLLIIDVSNATNPQLRGTLAITAALGVAVSGNYAYVATEFSGLLIIDVSNATNPQLRGTLATSEALGVAVSGNYAYVADASSGLRIIDVSNTTNPLLRGTLTTTDANGVAISGNYAYVADYSSGLRIIDVSNATNPQLLKTLATTDARGVAVSGNYAYVADYSSGLRIIDVSNATNPFLLYQFNTLGYAYNIALSGKTVYVATSTGLTILDMTNLPWLPFTSLVSPQTLLIAGPYAFITNDNVLGVFDVSNTSQVQYIGGWYTGFVTNHMDVMGNQLLLGYSGGITILNISNPAFPQLVADYPCAQDVQGFVVNNGTLYVPGSYQCQFEPAPSPAPAPVPQPLAPTPTIAPQFFNGLTPCPANQPLVLRNNDIYINKGQNLRLTPNNLAGYCGNSILPNLETAFNITGISHAKFKTRNSSGFWNNASSFFENDLSQGNVELIQDNSPDAPEFNFTLTDGKTTLPITNATIVFSLNQSFPIVNSIIVNVQNGGSTVLNASSFQISDMGTPIDNVVFTVNNVQNGYFRLITDNTSQLNDFTYYQVQEGQIEFVVNGTALPRINFSVSDGSGLPVQVSPIVNLFDIQNPQSPAVPEKAVIGAVGGAVALAAVTGLALFGLFKYQERKKEMVQNLGKAREDDYKMRAVTPMTS